MKNWFNDNGVQDDSNTDVGQAIISKLGTEVSLLTKLIPELEGILVLSADETTT
jgi:hypothetical protein